MEDEKQTNELTLEQLMETQIKNYKEATYNQLIDALKMYSTHKQTYLKPRMLRS